MFWNHVDTLSQCQIFEYTIYHLLCRVEVTGYLKSFKFYVSCRVHNDNISCNSSEVHYQALI